MPERPRVPITSSSGLNSLTAREITLSGSERQLIESFDNVGSVTCRQLCLDSCRIDVRRDAQVSHDLVLSLLMSLERTAVGHDVIRGV
jgi:hypothetical protein